MSPNGGLVTPILTASRSRDGSPLAGPLLPTVAVRCAHWAGCYAMEDEIRCALASTAQPRRFSVRQFAARPSATMSQTPGTDQILRSPMVGGSRAGGH